MKTLGLVGLGFAFACARTVSLGETPPDDAGMPMADQVLPPNDGPSDMKVCTVPKDDPNGNAPVCTQSAPPCPPDAGPSCSFSPTVKWAWSDPQPGWNGSIVTPLVANLTDDNGDGSIDLCDVPDVLVVAENESAFAGRIVLLAGDTGKLELTFDGSVNPYATPAIGDIDGDKMPDIVTNDKDGHILIYGHDGKLKIKGDQQDPSEYCAPFAIYDLDADGTPEIIGTEDVFDNKGVRKFGTSYSSYKGHYYCIAPTAADLDGDGKLEVIFGNAAYRSNGTPYWTTNGPPGHPQVGNLDADTDPEIFFAREDGIVVVEHDGTAKFGPIRLLGDPPGPNCWSKPGAIHDFDGDKIADLSASTCDQYGVYRIGMTGLKLDWAHDVDDPSGLSSSTAFDFLGLGVAQAVYGDQSSLWVFDGKTGQRDLQQPRESGTLIEYPVVADVDNDQHADIVVVNNDGVYRKGVKYTVVVYSDVQNRWIPARRIWNQHAYHVTNVREDGTIPKVMQKSWRRLNTFRTQAQLEQGADCAPNPH